MCQAENALKRHMACCRSFGLDKGPQLSWRKALVGVWLTHHRHRAPNSGNLEGHVRGLCRRTFQFNQLIQGLLLVTSRLPQITMERSSELIAKQPYRVVGCWHFRRRDYVAQALGRFVRSTEVLTAEANKVMASILIVDAYEVMLLGSQTATLTRSGLSEA